MRLIHSQPEDLIGGKTMHVIFGYQRSFTLLYPGKPNFLVAMQVRLKISQHLLLYIDRLIDRNGDGKLQDLHAVDFRFLNLPVKGNCVKN